MSAKDPASTWGFPACDIPTLWERGLGRRCRIPFAMMEDPTSLGWQRPGLPSVPTPSYQGSDLDRAEPRDNPTGELSSQLDAVPSTSNGPDFRVVRQMRSCPWLHTRFGAGLGPGLRRCRSQAVNPPYRREVPRDTLPRSRASRSSARQGPHRNQPRRRKREARAAPAAPRCVRQPSDQKTRGK